VLLLVDRSLSLLVSLHRKTAELPVSENSCWEIYGQLKTVNFLVTEAIEILGEKFKEAKA